MIFVYAMLVMAAIGAGLAAMEHHGLGGKLLDPQWSSVIGGVLTLYLVTTALLTVRRRVQGSLWIDASAMLVALAVGIFSVKFGFEALNSPTGKLDGQPAAPGFVFGPVALLAALGDIRMMLARGIQGAHRIARHLWRMFFAMFIATGSFFLGQANLFPKPLRIPALLALPVLLVLIVMLYWLWRVRIRRSFRGIVGVSSPEAILNDETLRQSITT